MQILKKGNYLKARHTGLELTFSLGNRKLPPNVLILNMPAGSAYPGTCPTDCRGCYAKKAERIYPGTRECRARNRSAIEQWDESTILTAVRELARKHGDKIDYFRIHESGDIFNSRYAGLLDKMAAILQEYNIRTWTYTKTHHTLQYANIVNSVTPEGEVNFGDRRWLAEKSAKFNAPICPGTTGICGTHCKYCLDYTLVLFEKH